MVYQDCITFLNRKLESFSSLKQYREFRETEAERLLVEHFRIQRIAMREMIDTRGRLYASASFENYEQESREQEGAVRALRKYAKDFPNRLKDGQNIIMLGPRGTGKDHLLMALAKEIFETHGVPTHWEQGVKLLNDIRDADFERSTRPRRDSKNHLGYSRSAHCEGQVLLSESLAPLALACYYSSREPVEQVCPILWMSDIVPPTGPLTEYQQTTIFNLIDFRYSNMLPTWVSVNAVKVEDLDARIGGQTADRLRDGALVVGCRWDSYRKIGRTRPAKNDADLWPLPDITVPEWLQAEDRNEYFERLRKEREA